MTASRTSGLLATANVSPAGIMMYNANLKTFYFICNFKSMYVMDGAYFKAK